ncbi:hypothetical protein LTR95_012295 [Oleoguttula sp. CCFEE 5521]
MPLTQRPKALLFDVFGTCVDWRKTVTEALTAAAKGAGETTKNADFWATFAQSWRNSYLTFTKSLAAANGSIPFKTVDEHHLDSLRELLSEHGLGSLLSDSQTVDLSLIWHRLDPWTDTVNGLAALNKAGFITVTLTNGNMSLIEDMVKHSGMPFSQIFSAELFNSYKPNPKIYLGASERLGLKPEECAMVAAHLDDLVGARACGLKTVYVERRQEERHPELKDREGLVDVWVREGEEGFVEVARQLDSV